MSHNVRQTSIDAFVKIRHELGERQIEILRAFEELCSMQRDATDQEVKQFLGKLDPNYVRPRRKELLDMEYIEPSCKRICKVTGATVIAWKVKRASSLLVA